MTLNDGKPLERAVLDGQRSQHDLAIIAEALRPSGMNFIADTLEETANNIEYLLMEIERLKKYEKAVDQILKPDNDEMMGRTR